MTLSILTMKTMFQRPHHSPTIIRSPQVPILAALALFPLHMTLNGTTTCHHRDLPLIRPPWQSQTNTATPTAAFPLSPSGHRFYSRPFYVER
jgi:hypothetical protein